MEIHIMLTENQIKTQKKTKQKKNLVLKRI